MNVSVSAESLRRMEKRRENLNSVDLNDKRTLSSRSVEQEPKSDDSLIIHAVSIKVCIIKY